MSGEFLREHGGIDGFTLNLWDLRDEKQVDREEILKNIWGYNPFWVKKGYREYMLPSVAWKLEPGE